MFSGVVCLELASSVCCLYCFALCIYVYMLLCPKHATRSLSCYIVFVHLLFVVFVKCFRLYCCFFTPNQGCEVYVMCSACVFLVWLLNPCFCTSFRCFCVCVFGCIVAVRICVDCFAMCVLLVLFMLLLFHVLLFAVSVLPLCCWLFVLFVFALFVWLLLLCVQLACIGVAQLVMYCMFAVCLLCLFMFWWCVCLLVCVPTCLCFICLFAQLVLYGILTVVVVFVVLFLLFPNLFACFLFFKLVSI